MKKFQDPSQKKDTNYLYSFSAKVKSNISLTYHVYEKTYKVQMDVHNQGSLFTIYFNASELESLKTLLIRMDLNIDTK
jgi:hypothetical protein